MALFSLAAALLNDVWSYAAWQRALLWLGARGGIAG